MTGRFAPTPSGRMHMGNAYAMLAAWLSARARHELILLRIEDIDAPRAVPDADRWIMDDLTWLGLDWDGEPVYQSQRLGLYEEVFRLLRDADPSPLYPCFCSRAEIRAASAPQEGDRFIIYPGTCRRLLAHDPHEVRRRLDAGVRHSWRFAVPPAGAHNRKYCLRTASLAPRTSIWGRSWVTWCCDGRTVCSHTSSSSPWTTC